MLWLYEVIKIHKFVTVFPSDCDLQELTKMTWSAIVYFEFNNFVTNVTILRIGSNPCIIIRLK